MLAANLYLVLKAGLTVGASIPSAVIGLAVLAVLTRNRAKSTILEANIIQTAASTGETLAAALGFSVVALVISGAWTDFGFVRTTLIALTGGFAGVLMMIPLRRTLIVNSPEITYPEGTACAEVLQAGARPGVLADIAKSGVVGAFFALLSKCGAMAEQVTGAMGLGRSALPAGFSTSPALLSVGYIVGLNVSSLLFIGSAIIWFLYIPMVGSFDPANVETPLFKQALGVWSAKGRYVGVGCMLLGGVWTLVGLWPRIRETLGMITKSGGSSDSVDHREQDLMGAPFWALLSITFAVIAGLCVDATGSLWQGMVITVVMGVFAFFIVALASYICGLVGSSNSPVSGMTLLTLFVAALLIKVLGIDSQTGVLSTLVIGSIICGAACTAGNTSQDLKTGYLVGATPRKQQIICLVAVVVSALVAAPMLSALLNAYGFGTAPGNLEVPKGQLIATISTKIFGDGPIPWDLIGLGALLGLGFGILDSFLKRRGSTFRTPIMPVAVGMYVPIYIPMTMFIGGIVRWWVDRGQAEQGEAKAMSSRGVLIGSGLIAGESITGMLLAIPLLFGAKLAFGLGISPALLATVLFCGLVVVFARLARRSN